MKKGQHQTLGQLNVHRTHRWMNIRLRMKRKQQQKLNKKCTKTNVEHFIDNNNNCHITNSKPTNVIFSASLIYVTASIRGTHGHYLPCPSQSSNK